MVLKKELTFKQYLAIATVCVAMIALTLMAGCKPKKDYADKQKWFVNHSQIPLNNK